MKVIVTGGAGFIGSHIADRLLAKGIQVAVIDDLSSGRRENVSKDALFKELDIRRAEELNAFVGDFRPDAICHQAAQTSVAVSTREPIRDAEINIMGSLNLLEACRAHGVERFVFASTGGAIYGEVPEGAADENTKPLPISPYACSKLSFEGYLQAYAHEHGLRPTILRYANVYGPRQDPHGEAGVVAIFNQRLVKGESIQVNARRDKGDAGCVRDYVYVDDVVRANLLALEGSLKASILNVGTGIATTTRALAESIAKAHAVEAEIHAGDRRAGDLQRSLLKPNAELAAHGLTSLDEGIAQTARYFAS